LRISSHKSFLIRVFVVIWSWTTCCWTPTALWRLPTLVCVRKEWVTATGRRRSAALRNSWHPKCWQSLHTHGQLTGGGSEFSSLKCLLERFSIFWDCYFYWSLVSKNFILSVGWHERCLTLM